MNRNEHHDNVRDAAISRVVDRRDTPADWDQLDRGIAGDAGLPAELLGALRSDALLRAAVAPAAGAAARATLSVAAAPPRRRWAWSGWAVAAGVALAWSLSAFSALRPAPEHAVAAPAAPEVLRQLDTLVLSARPAQQRAGMFEVTYLRRQVERAFVRELYQLGMNEYGEPTPLQVEPARLRRPTVH